MQKVTWKFSIMRMECSRTESTLENALGLPTNYVTLQQRPSSGRGLNCILREPCKIGLSENTGLPMCEPLLLKTLPPQWGRGGPSGSACRRNGYADAYTIIVHFNSNHDPFWLSLGLACMTRFGWFHDWGTSRSELNQPMDLSSMDSPFGNQTSLPWQWNVHSDISCWRWF